MLKRFFSLLVIFSLFANFSVKAKGGDEGMWMPFLIQKLNFKKMQKMGLELSPSDIYSVNKSSLKDAVVALDHGSCTGEIVSASGLLLTNHHCGYGEIQAHSTVKHDYLTDGFVAKRKSDELPNPGKTASFLIRAEDVTNQINARLNDQMDEDERNDMIKKVAKEIEDKATQGTHYEAQVQSFYKGNNFYLFVYETFKDIRLVYAPPSSIGKYGADTDNWVWPRHTGDFSVFRVYADKNGKPAEYSKDNVPYKPRRFLKVSLKGYEKGDFAMVLGYPGSTNRYLTAAGIEQVMENENKIRIKLRGMKQAIMQSEMDKSDKVRIQYASKYSRSSNYYKYSIGQNKGLTNLNVVAKKQALEKELTKWINETKARKNKYGKMLDLIDNAVKKNDKYDIAFNYWIEAIWLGAEVTKFSLNASQMLNTYIQNKDKKLKKDLIETADEFFKDYYEPVDKQMFVKMMEVYKKDLDKEFYPAFFKIVKEKYNGSFKKYADYVYSKSIFVNKKRFMNFVNKPNQETLKNDPAVLIAKDAAMLYQMITNATSETDKQKAKGERLYMDALRQMQSNKALYPNANSTMRFTYGKVGNYEPRDAVVYKHFTTLEGYMEKEDVGAEKTAEFYVHQKLKDLYKAKDYGQYGIKCKDGSKKMRVAFTTDNDITGGNSGSPVLNGKGELIGIAFDGNWEAMSGDIAFETELQKCINVDIRFVLFVMDKYSGAKHLVKEMSLVK